MAKKKVRVYKDGGYFSYAAGGETGYRKQMGGMPPMTQDSQPDPIHQQKSADFVKKLRTLSQVAIAEKEREFITGLAQDGYTLQQTDIPEHLGPGSNLQPGAITKDYGKIQDSNLKQFTQAYDRSTPDWANPINLIGTGAQRIMSQPDKWQLNLPEGQDQQDLFKQFVNPSYGNVNLNDFEIQDVEKNGKNRTLNYKATGSQEYVGPDFYPNAVQPFIPTMQGFQDGGNFPGAGIFNSDMFANLYGDVENLETGDPNESINNMGTSHGFMKFLGDLNTDVANQTGTQGPQYDAMGVTGDRTVTDQGQLELEKVSKFKQATDENPYLLPSGMIAGMQLAANVGNLDDRAAQERNIRERTSNVHRLFQAQGSDRGDYLSNVPGVGNFLKPDQHTRMGYDTKVAQDGYQVDGGYNVGDEVDMRPEQIEQLIADGYQLEYLD